MNKINLGGSFYFTGITETNGLQIKKSIVVSIQLFSLNILTWEKWSPLNFTQCIERTMLNWREETICHSRKTFWAMFSINTLTFDFRNALPQECLNDVSAYCSLPGLPLEAHKASCSPCSTTSSTGRSRGTQGQQTETGNTHFRNTSQKTPRSSAVPWYFPSSACVHNTVHYCQHSALPVSTFWLNGHEQARHHLHSL